MEQESLPKTADSVAGSPPAPPSDRRPRSSFRWLAGGAVVLVLATAAVVLARSISAPSDSGEGRIIDYGPSSAVVASPTTTTPTAYPYLPSAPVDKTTPVTILNNSLVAGLGTRVASQLAADGWTNLSVGNYAGRTMDRTTVYYGANSASEKAAAEYLAEILEAAAERRTPDLSANTVYVIVTGK
ncbi:LytR C-terminal domain-containing protein [Nocardia aurea]|uniref:LytR C-terminal domain-containing protein n=1 Tax=Nocardia aurea TaxID=2144174 RepID=A0ABV3G583_9NOCA